MITPCVLQDALLVIGSELLDLHLVSDAASDADETETTAPGPGIGTGAAPGSAISFTGPAGLRLAKVTLQVQATVADDVQHTGGRLLCWSS